MSSTGPLTILVVEDRCGSVHCAVLASGDSPARDFLEKDCEEIREKGKNDPRSTARARFMALFRQMVQLGRLGENKYKHLDGKIYEFKREVRNRQIRFPAFQDGNRWILTHGFEGKHGKGKTPQAEIDRAHRIEADYWNRKKQAEAAGRQNQ